MQAVISFSDSVALDEVIHLYQSNEWSSAKKPDLLLAALNNSDALVTARLKGRLVGLPNAISDGSLVVYFLHMLVLPEEQGKGIGGQLMTALLEKYRHFHQLVLTADGKSVEFYKRMGFERAGNTVPMWVYAGKEH